MVRKMGRFLVVIVIALLMSVSCVLADETLSLNAVPTSGKAPLEVSFELVSSEEIISVSWDFESDGTEDSTEFSPSYIYPSAGTYTATADVTTASGGTIVSTTVTVKEPFSVSVIAAPSSGITPLNVKFTASVSGSTSYFLYSWDFNDDKVVDSTEQNPSYTFENVGDVVVKLTVTDAAQASVTKKVPITVSSYDSKIKITSYFPTSLQLKENQVTFLVSNEGKDTIKDISAKVIGEGVQHLSSTTISRLKSGEQDSLTVKVNVLKEGAVTASVKIDEKIFPITFTVEEQEDLYYEKKADGFLVEEVFDSIKDAKDQLQAAQQQILTSKLEEASVNVNLAAPSVDEITRRLETAIKQEQTILMWLKENAVAITAIIAAVGTLSGLAVRVTKGAKKLGEDVKEKLVKKEVKEKKDIPNLDNEDKESNQDLEKEQEKQEEIKEESSGDKL